VPAIRVFHCDDSGSFLVLVRHWLEDHAGVQWVGAERDRTRVVDAVAEAKPDVVLLDTMGRPGDGQLMDELRRAAPGVRLIVYSGYVHMLGPDYLGAGAADAYVDKSDDDAALVAAIRQVMGQ
jgi:DNA-binding NarL/FixJ family response regulator